MGPGFARPESPRAMHGIIRVLKPAGYGFVDGDGQTRYFFPASRCLTPFDVLRERDLVTFDLELDPEGGGDRAINVVVRDP